MSLCYLLEGYHSAHHSHIVSGQTVLQHGNVCVWSLSL